MAMRKKIKLGRLVRDQNSTSRAHGRVADLRVRIICRLEAEILDTHFFEEYTHESCVPHREYDAPHESMSARVRTDQIGKCQPPVSDNTLNLVKLRQMRRVHCLVTKYAVDTKQLCGPKAVALETWFTLDAAGCHSNIVLFAIFLCLTATPCRKFVQHMC